MPDNIEKEKKQLDAIIKKVNKIGYQIVDNTNDFGDIDQKHKWLLGQIEMEI